MEHPIYKALNEFKKQYGYDLMSPTPAHGYEAEEPLEHAGAGGAKINNNAGATNASDT